MPGIEAIGALATPHVSALARLADTNTTAVAGTSGAGGDFGSRVTGALEALSASHQAADQLAVQAATGSLADVHDYTIAATEAALATELTVAVRNKALEAFNQIMNLPL
ncbi:MAG: flagellar hook-basal body complex protein FliE [Actinomycetota bacterium]|nr:flagellar hook-basal body complex protein FliE [Actinomycetota bacterium]